MGVSVVCNLPMFNELKIGIDLEMILYVKYDSTVFITQHKFYGNDNSRTLMKAP